MCPSAPGAIPRRTKLWRLRRVSSCCGPSPLANGTRTKPWPHRQPPPCADSLRTRNHRPLPCQACPGRAAAAAAARHSPVLSRDRRSAVPLRKHHQVAGDIDLPQTRGFLTQRGGPTPQETRPPRQMTSGRHPSSIEAILSASGRGATISFGIKADGSDRGGTGRADGGGVTCPTLPRRERKSPGTDDFGHMGAGHRNPGSQGRVHGRRVGLAERVASQRGQRPLTCDYQKKGQ